MSNTSASIKRSHRLSEIFYYGKECLLNRWKLLATLAFFFIFLPRFTASIVLAADANRFAARIRAGALTGGNILDQMEMLVSQELNGAFIFIFASFFAVLVGVLAIARSSSDYFEQRPSTLFSTLQVAGRTLLLKGFGALVMLVLILIPSAALALLRVIVLCLLVMLPVELVSGHSGGLRSVIDTVFLRYVPKGARGRWPAFSNMMTIGGLALSLLFLIQLGLTYLLDLDVILGVKASWWAGPMMLFNQIEVSRAHVSLETLEFLLDAAMIAATMPFVAALRHLEGRDGLGLHTSSIV